ncbi:MAG: glycosyltransferase [Caldilineaceae bacterium]
MLEIMLYSNISAHALKNMAHKVSVDTIRLAYVGNVVPDRSEYREGNYSYAANMWQINALNALIKQGLKPSLVLSQRLTRTYQHSRLLISKPRSDYLDNGLKVNLIPFFNYSLLRPLTISIAILFYLLQWGWNVRNRNCSKVIFLYNLLEPPGFIVWLGAKLIKAKIICCVNDIYVPGDTVPNTLVWNFAFRLQKWVLPRFDGRIFITDAIASDFAPGKEYIRAEGAVEDSVLEKFMHPLGCQRTEKNSKNRFVIVAAGSLTQLNGFEEIVDGFLRTQNPNYRFVIAGAGELQPNVIRAAQRDMRIEYLGRLPFAEVLKLYKDADCIINMRLTKRFNTKYVFPSKIFEALASATPVITTCPGHVAQEYKEIAFLLTEETSEALAKTIDLVAGLPWVERQRIGTAAAQHIRTHNTWTTMGKKMTEYILNVIEFRS